MWRTFAARKSQAPALRRLLVAGVAAALLGAPLSAAEKRYSRTEALGQLRASAAKAQVIVVGKIEMRRGQRVLVCLDPIKSREGKPGAGDTMPVNAPLPEGREGIVFISAYPADAFSGEIRWLRDGKMNECPELALADIKAALRPE